VRLHVSVSLLRDATACRQAHSRASVERYFRDCFAPISSGLAMTEFFPSREPLKVVRTKRWIHRQFLSEPFRRESTGFLV